MNEIIHLEVWEMKKKTKMKSMLHQFTKVRQERSCRKTGVKIDHFLMVNLI